MKWIKKIFRMVRDYRISKDMWKAKMREPLVFRKPTPEECERIYNEGILK